MQLMHSFVAGMHQLTSHAFDASTAHVLEHGINVLLHLANIAALASPVAPPLRFANLPALVRLCRTCPTCRVLLRDTAQLHEHLQLGSCLPHQMMEAKKPRTDQCKCTVCYFTCTTDAELVAHREHSACETTFTAGCPKCRRLFITMKLLDAHLAQCRMQQPSKCFISYFIKFTHSLQPSLCHNVSRRSTLHSSARSAAVCVQRRPS